MMENLRYQFMWPPPSLVQQATKPGVPSFLLLVRVFVCGDVLILPQVGVLCYCSATSLNTDM